MPPRCQLLPGRLLRAPQPAHRAFATSAALWKPKGGDLGSHLPKHVIPRDAIIPDYPYGPSLLFKQSNKGLYGGQTIQFGNNVSPDTKTKTRRHWKPNILSKSFYSVALKKRIKLRATSKVLKTMDREGGLDEYLLKESEARVKELGPTGWKLRWLLMQQPVVIARFRAEAAALGLAQDIIDKQWPERPIIERKIDVNIAKQKREEARAEEQRRKDRAQQLRYQRHKRMASFSELALRKRLAPERSLAEKMGIADTARFFELMKMIRDEKTVLAYMRAEKMGKVEQAGGRATWLARYKANRMYRWERRQEERRTARIEGGGPFDPESTQVEPTKESKDAWGDLIEKNKGQPRAQATA